MTPDPVHDELTSLSQAIDALPPRAREVLHLHGFERLPYADIAALLDIPKRDVIAQLTRALIHCCRWHDESRAAPPGDDKVRDAIGDTASAWFTRVRDERLTTGDRVSLGTWLAAGTRHRETWTDLQRVWNGITVLAKVGAQRLPPPMEVGNAAAGIAE